MCKFAHYTRYYTISLTSVLASLLCLILWFTRSCFWHDTALTCTVSILEIYSQNTNTGFRIYDYDHILELMGQDTVSIRFEEVVGEAGGGAGTYVIVSGIYT